jgi:uncharacterized protein YbjT (DUF2867 family)
MLAITGATGQLGQATLRHLTAKSGAGQLVALVRNPKTALRSSRERSFW